MTIATKGIITHFFWEVWFCLNVWTSTDIWDKGISKTSTMDGCYGHSRRANVINILKSGIVLNYIISAPTSQKTQTFFTGTTSRLTAFSEANGIYSED